MTDPVTRALAYLSRVVEPPCPQLAALVRRVGPVEAADRVKRRAIDDQLMRSTEARHDIDCAARDLEMLARVGGRLVTAADAELAVQNGVDGILVSNHGGRGEDNGRSTIDALPEIIAAVKGRIPVIVDSGFRRGTDTVKALAMGAQAVGIGRPYLWGLGAFGQEGVERVLEIVRTETRAAMQQCGARSVKELNPGFVRRAT